MVVGVGVVVEVVVGVGVVVEVVVGQGPLQADPAVQVWPAEHGTGLEAPLGQYEPAVHGYAPNLLGQ